MLQGKMKKEDKEIIKLKINSNKDLKDLKDQ